MKAQTTNPVGDALVSYSLANGGVTVHCNVRNMAFPSGNPVTADDFLYTVKRALNLTTGPIFDVETIGISSMSQVIKVSPSQFTLKLHSPSPIVGQMLHDQDFSVLDSKVITQHATASDPWATKWMATNSLGGGAYTLAQFTPGTGVTLQANPHYWEPAPYFGTVLLQEVPNSDEMALLLKRGTIDIAENLSLSTVAHLRNAAGVKVVSIPARNQDMFGLVETHKPFDDVRVRQALAYAIPYEGISKNVLYGLASPPRGIWPQNSTSFDAKVAWPYQTNEAKAKSLLSEAGLTKGFTFTCEISTADPDAAAEAIAVQSALRGINVTMNISQVAPAVLQQHLEKKSMEAWISSEGGDYVDDPYYHLLLWFESTSVLNWFGYSNPSIDKLGKSLSSELNTTKRLALASQAQGVLNQTVPVIILAEPHFVVAVRDEIAGVALEPDSLIRYNKLRAS